MTAALVGSLGTPTTGATSAGITPAYGQTPTAGNLLICWASVAAFTTMVIPPTPAGWTSGIQINDASRGSTIFYKTAAGGDAAPSFAGATNHVYSAQLGEFSDAQAAVDKAGSTNAGGSPCVITASAPDAAVGELVIYALGENVSVAATSALLVTTGTNFTPHDVTDKATSSRNHYCYGYGITTANAVPNKASITFDAASSNGEGVIASFYSLSWQFPPAPQRSPLSL